MGRVEKRYSGFIGGSGGFRYLHLLQRLRHYLLRYEFYPSSGDIYDLRHHSGMGVHQCDELRRRRGRALRYAYHCNSHDDLSDWKIIEYGK